MKILHLADLHLGQKHNNSEIRFDDFFLSFDKTIQLAIDQKVQIIIIAGDLFDKSNISALTLERTIHLFQKAKKNNIRIVVIEGNHDRPNIIDKFSFLDYLNSEWVLDLLKFNHKKLTLDKFSLETRTGGYLEFPNFRIVGVGYWTKVLEDRIVDLKKALINIKQKEGDKLTILMLHGAVGKGIMGGISKDSIELLKEEVDYLALGHWHRKQEEDGWIFNPGSLEHTDINEQDIIKGAFLIEIKDNKKFSCQFLETPKRDLFRLKIECHDLNNVNEVYQKIKETVLTKEDFLLLQTPMVKITLRGKVNFNPLEVNNKEIVNLLNNILKWSEQQIERVEEAKPENLFSSLSDSNKIKTIKNEVVENEEISEILFLEVNNLLNIDDIEISGKITDDDFNIKSLEKEIMSDIIKSSSQYQDQTEEIIKISQDFKEMVLAGYDNEEIIKLL